MTKEITNENPFTSYKKGERNGNGRKLNRLDSKMKIFNNSTSKQFNISTNRLFGISTTQHFNL
jgi:hypothetical protein